MEADLFEPAHWGDVDSVPGYSGGRGATLFVDIEATECVLRHYHRGGAVGKFLQDQFIWLGEERTRPFLEWDLLDQMYRAGLPCPEPVAARYVRHGWLYTADLITRRLPNVRPFSTRLDEGPVSAEVWGRVGTCIGRFHAAGYYHADLSTHNLQIDTDENIFLLDFDRGEHRPRGHWQQQNLDRLHRSCVKISRDGVARFQAADWEALLDAYRTVAG